MLGIDKCGSLTLAAAKHTPLQNHQAERKARAKRSRPLNRLGELPLLRSLVFFRVYCLADQNQAEVRKELKRAEKREKELDKLVETAFEEKVSSKIPESVCVRLIEKYTAEQSELKEKITTLSQGLEEVAQVKTDVDEFIRRLRKYCKEPKLTREMCLSLFEKIIIGGKETVTGKPQEVYIFYKIDVNSVL